MTLTSSWPVLTVPDLDATMCLRGQGLESEVRDASFEVRSTHREVTSRGQGRKVRCGTSLTMCRRCTRRCAADVGPRRRCGFPRSEVRVGHLRGQDQPKVGPTMSFPTLTMYFRCQSTSLRGVPRVLGIRRMCKKRSKIEPNLHSHRRPHRSDVFTRSGRDPDLLRSNPDDVPHIVHREVPTSQSGMPGTVRSTFLRCHFLSNFHAKQ